MILDYTRRDVHLGACSSKDNKVQNIRNSIKYGSTELGTCMNVHC